MNASNSTTMTELRTLTCTIKAKPRHLAIGAGTPISRSASEQALARLGWKSVHRKGMASGCYELVSSSGSSPSVWMHSSSCTCKRLPEVASRKPTDDELLASKILAVAELHRQDKTISNTAHARRTGLASLTRYFTPVGATPKHVDTIASLCQACASLVIDTVADCLFVSKIPITRPTTSNHFPSSPPSQPLARHSDRNHSSP